MQITQTLELFQRQRWQNLRDGMEHAWAFLSAQLPSQTELKLGEQADSWNGLVSMTQCRHVLTVVMPTFFQALDK